MVFHAQFLLPREVAGDGTWMAYLFLWRDGGESFRPDGGDNALVGQPGPAPTLVDTVDRATDVTQQWDHSRFRARNHNLLLEYAVDLESGTDPEEWTDEGARGRSRRLEQGGRHTTLAVAAAGEASGCRH